MLDEKEKKEEESNLLYNVAEVCSQDGIDICQSVTHIWELRKRGTMSKYGS